MKGFDALAALTIHDVKNRLNLLAQRADANGDGETLRVAMEAATTLTRLLSAYKAEQGRLAADIDARVPADVLYELAAEFSGQTPLMLTVDVAEAPTLAWYDEALVRMVLQDALYNALRHAVAGIRLSARASDGYLEFAVHDDGPGFPADMLGSLAQAPVASREGTGLGLYLAQCIAGLHQNGGRRGSVELSNEGGAVFRLRLPR